MSKYNRLIKTIHKVRFMSIISGVDRAKYLKKYKLIQIGENCMFQSRNFPMDPEFIKIHNNVTVAAKVTFVTHDAIRHVLAHIDKEKYMPHYGCIEVEENVFIGLGSIIMPNVHIGKNSVIAAGSLVNKDVPSNSIVGGVPARIIGNFEDLHKARIKEGKELKDLTKEELVDYLWNEFYQNREKFSTKDA